MIAVSDGNYNVLIFCFSHFKYCKRLSSGRLQLPPTCLRWWTPLRWAAHSHSTLYQGGSDVISMQIFSGVRYCWPVSRNGAYCESAGETEREFRLEEPVSAAARHELQYDAQPSILSFSAPTFVPQRSRTNNRSGGFAQVITGNMTQQQAPANSMASNVMTASAPSAAAAQLPGVQAAMAMSAAPQMMSSSMPAEAPPAANQVEANGSQMNAPQRSNVDMAPTSHAPVQHSVAYATYSDQHQGGRHFGNQHQNAPHVGGNRHSGGNDYYHPSQPYQNNEYQYHSQHSSMQSDDPPSMHGRHRGGHSEGRYNLPPRYSHSHAHAHAHSHSHGHGENSHSSRDSRDSLPPRYQWVLSTTLRDCINVIIFLHLLFFITGVARGTNAWTMKAEHRAAWATSAVTIAAIIGVGRTTSDRATATTTDPRDRADRAPSRPRRAE